MCCQRILRDSKATQTQYKTENAVHNRFIKLHTREKVVFFARLYGIDMLLIVGRSGVLILGDPNVRLKILGISSLAIVLSFEPQFEEI